MKYIYTITTFDCRRDQRTVGWFSKRQDAINVVKDNICDIWEFSYDWVVIEKIPESLYPIITKEWWYKWNHEEKRYLKCSKPKLFHNLLGCSIA